MKIIKKDRIKIAICEAVQKAAMRLHMGPATLATVTLEIADKFGNVEQRIEMKSNSFVRNYYNGLAYSAIFKSPYNSTETAVGTFGDGVDTPIKDTGGTLRGVASSGGTTATSSFAWPGYSQSSMYPNLNSGIAAPAGVSTYGIVLGTSDTAESFSSYAMGAQIAHGTSTGRMNYAAQTALASFTFTSGTKKLTATHTRTFTNVSGATITVKEIGFILRFGVGTNSDLKALIIRDLLASPADVETGKTLTVTYNLSLVMSN